MFAFMERVDQRLSNLENMTNGILANQSQVVSYPTSATSSKTMEPKIPKGKTIVESCKLKLQ